VSAQCWIIKNKNADFAINVSLLNNGFSHNSYTLIWKTCPEIL